MTSPLGVGWVNDRDSDSSSQNDVLGDDSG